MNNALAVAVRQAGWGRRRVAGRLEGDGPVQVTPTASFDSGSWSGPCEVGDSFARRAGAGHRGRRRADRRGAARGRPAGERSGGGADRGRVRGCACVRAGRARCARVRGRGGAARARGVPAGAVVPGRVRGSRPGDARRDRDRDRAGRRAGVRHGRRERARECAREGERAGLASRGRGSRGVGRRGRHRRRTAAVAALGRGARCVPGPFVAVALAAGGTWGFDLDVRRVEVLGLSAAVQVPEAAEFGRLAEAGARERGIGWSRAGFGIWTMPARRPWRGGPPRGGHRAAEVVATSRSTS